MSVNLKTLHLASPKHKHKFETKLSSINQQLSPTKPTVSPQQNGHQKSLSQSSVIEDDGEKFYSPLTKEKSNNSSTYSDLDAVRQILVSPDIITSSPQKAVKKPENILVNEVDNLTLTEPEKKKPSNQVYSPLIKDSYDIPPTKSRPTAASIAASNSCNTGISNASHNQVSEELIVKKITKPVEDNTSKLSTDDKSIENGHNDEGDDGDISDNGTDNATIKSAASFTSNISNKTEKALKYEEMKLLELKKVASQLYDHSYTKVPVEEYLSVLCDPGNAEAKKLRSLYLKKFDWNISLLDSLRILCNNLYFRGESQNISRIIESFSVVWTQRFPKNLFGNQYAVYLIAYSLILLNSDLHSLELSKHISKEIFVKNTLNALKAEKLYPKDSMSAMNCLRTYFESIELNELKLLGNSSPSPSSHSGNGNGNQLSAYNHNNSSFANLRKSSFNITRSSTKANAISSRIGSSKHDALALRTPADSNHLLESSLGSNSKHHGIMTPNEQQPVGFLHALQRGSSQLGSRLDKDLKKHKSTASITSALSSNTMKTVETSNTMGTCNSITTSNKSSFNKASSKSNLYNSNNGSSLNANSNGLSSASSFAGAPSNLEASDIIIEEDESDMELELTGPPWAKEGLLKIKKFEKSKGIFGKASHSLSNSNSNHHHFSKNFFNGGASDNYLESSSTMLSRTSTNTSSFGKSLSKNSQGYNHSASHSAIKWKLNFTVVSRGEVKLFYFNSKNSSPASVSSSAFSSSNLSTTASLMDSSSGKLRKKFSKLRLDRGNNNNNEPVVIGAGNAIPIGGGVGDGNWMRNAISSGTFSLISTYSKIIPDDSLNNKNLKSKELETFWALKLPGNYDFENDNHTLSSKAKKETASYINNEDSILIFSAGTREIAEEYVFTCNYWAARLTAIPTQTESISNKEYGWGLILSKKNVSEILQVRIHKWEPLVPSIVSSTLSIKKQLLELFKYVQVLENLISDHLKLKDHIDEFIHSIASENQKNLLSLNKVFNAIQSNWNGKYTYLVNEHNQFKDYVLTLKEAIDLKQKKANELEEN